MKYDKNAKGEWKTIRGTHIFIPEGSHLSDVLRSKKWSLKGASKEAYNKKEAKLRETEDKMLSSYKGMSSPSQKRRARDIQKMRDDLARTREGMSMGSTKETNWRDKDIKPMQTKGLQNLVPHRTTEQINNEYNELSKKMQQDDYYYRPEDDRRLKELRAEYDSSVAKGQVDTKYNDYVDNLQPYEVYETAMALAENTKDWDLKSEINKRLDRIDRASRRGEGYANKPTKELREILKENQYKEINSDGSVSMPDLDNDGNNYIFRGKVDGEDQRMLVNFFANSDGDLEYTIFKDNGDELDGGIIEAEEGKKWNSLDDVAKEIIDFQGIEGANSFIKGDEGTYEDALDEYGFTNQPQKNANDKFLEKAKALYDKDAGKISEEDYYKKLSEIDGTDYEKEKAKINANLDRLGVEKPDFLKENTEPVEDRLINNMIVSHYGDDVAYRDKDNHLWVTSRQQYNDYVNGKKDKMGATLVMDDDDALKTMIASEGLKRYPYEGYVADQKSGNDKKYKEFVDSEFKKVKEKYGNYDSTNARAERAKTNENYRPKEADYINTKEAVKSGQDFIKGLLSSKPIHKLGQLNSTDEEVNLNSKEAKKSLQETKRKADEWRIAHGEKPVFSDKEKGITENKLDSGVKVKGDRNVIPRNFTKGYGKFKVETNGSKNLNDDYEITKDEYGTYHAKNLRTGETMTTFVDHLRNNNVFEFTNKTKDNYKKWSAKKPSKKSSSKYEEFLKGNK